MNDLEMFINTIITMNTKDELSIDKKSFFDNVNIKNIIKEYSFNAKEKDNIYIFAIYLFKIRNKKLSNLKELYSVNKLDLLIFNTLATLKEEKVNYLSCLFIRYLYRDINYKKLENFIKKLKDLKIEKYYFMGCVYNEDGIYIDGEYGKDLYENQLAEKTFNIGTVEYKLNKEGKEFFDNVYLNPTKKEKEIYAKEIDYNKMATFDSAKNHKKYFKETMEKIGKDENFIKTARLQDNVFKDFFQEYDVLIKYAIAKYGENCIIRWCGKEKKEKLEYDGIIKLEELEEKIEISSPFHDEEEKIRIKELNRLGISCTKVLGKESIEGKIKKTVEDRLNKKNSNNNYNETINLVIMFDDFEYVLSEQIADENYINSLFDEFKNREYKFKSISILVDRYSGDKIKLEPRIIEIK